MPQTSKSLPTIDIDVAIAKVKGMGVNPDRVSYPCLMALADPDNNDHTGCQGVLYPWHGPDRYMRCRCPVCKHKHQGVVHD